jgi:hypothetical protein
MSLIQIADTIDQKIEKIRMTYVDDIADEA